MNASPINSAAIKWDYCQRQQQGVLLASMGQRTAAWSRDSSVTPEYERALADYLFMLSVKQGLLMVAIGAAAGPAANEPIADGAA